MEKLVNWILLLVSSDKGQRAIRWLGSLIFGLALPDTKKQIAGKFISEIIEREFAHYELIIENEKLLGVDGLTEEEKLKISEAKSRVKKFLVTLYEKTDGK